MRDIFVSGIEDSALRESLLRIENLTIDSALKHCQAKELAVRRNEKIKPQMDVAELQNNKGVLKDMVRTGRVCRQCGYQHTHGKCPARGKTCNNCKKMGHFGKMCRTVHEIDIGNDSASTGKQVTIDEVRDNYLKIDSISVGSNAVWKEYLTINDVNIEFKIDSGAQCNVISEIVFNTLKVKKIDQPKAIIKAFGNHSIPVVGVCKLPCQFSGKQYLIEFYIVKNAYINLLGLDSCVKLGIIKVVNHIEQIPKQYQELFDGQLGKIPKIVKLFINSDVRPIVLPTRKLAFALHDKVKAKLNEIVNQGVIEPVDKPTDWVSQMVVIQKPSGDLRICIDPRPLNKALKRSHFSLPTFEEVTAKIGKAKLFTKLDALSGFWLLPLDDKSADLCTFQTPFGRFRFLRLPFGLNCSGEIFHAVISKMFAGVEGCITYQDDILVYADNQEIMSERINKVLEISRLNGVKFNLNKCKFNQSEIVFLGHRFNQMGTGPENERVKAILALNAPIDKTSLQRILGMFNYVSKFIPNFSSIAEPLRELLKKDHIFQWNEEADKSFNNLKKCLTNAPVLGYYNKNMPLLLSVDASSTGLGAVLMQNGRPLAYASRALTDCQKRYAQIEKELLAIVFGVEKFRQYICGKDITVETDHKPLVPIFEKPLSKIPIRLQRMILRLQPFRIKLIYKPGKDLLIADSLSRDFNKSSVDTELDLDNDYELQVHMLIENLPITKKNLELIRERANEDVSYSSLKNLIQGGWPRYRKDVSDSLKDYYDFQNELTVHEEIIFKNETILVPQNLKQMFLEKLHVGHPGIVRFKERARSCLFWVGMNKDIEKYSRMCKVCQTYQNNQTKSQMVQRQAPQLSWSEVGADVFEFYGEQFLEVVDYYSNFIEVVRLEDTCSETIIRKMRSIFARHGIPLKLFTDGASYFTSNKFTLFVEQWNFTHITLSPHYPKSNGLAESAVKTCKKIFRNCIESKQDVYLALLHHRNTRREGLPSPAEMIMCRKLHTDVPIVFS